jgi:uncharacterized protein
MFQTSTPVVGEAFHNREAEIELLTRALEKLPSGSPQWVAILGPRKIGKTSLVLEAARRCESPAMHIVTLDVEEHSPASLGLFRRLALRVLDAAFSPELGESLERLVRAPSAYRSTVQRSERFSSLPAALRAEIIEIVDGKAIPERLHAWLDLPERLAKVLDLHFVIALDEFQELDELSSKDLRVFARLRSVWQKHRRVSYFISGSARSMLLALVAEESSPFFQHFSIIDLGPFSQEAAIELLRQRDGNHAIPKEIAQKAVDVLGGHPFYLQLLGEALTAQPHTPGTDDLKDALQSLLFSPTGRLSLFFEREFRRVVGRSTYLAATLDALVEGPATVTAIASRIQTPSGATVTYLERLKDAVERTPEGQYQLVDRTFALWLKWRRPGGTIVPMIVVGDEAEQSVARALSAMGFDLVYQSRASRGAFDLLATRGAMQLGVQVKRSSLPLRFTREEWSRMEAEASRLRWRWVLAAVTPDDGIAVLDPQRARKGREIRIGEHAAIGNLLQWMDGSGRSKPRG